MVSVEASKDLCPPLVCRPLCRSFYHVLLLFLNKFGIGSCQHSQSFGIKAMLYELTKAELRCFRRVSRCDHAHTLPKTSTALPNYPIETEAALRLSFSSFDFLPTVNLIYLRSSCRRFAVLYQGHGCMWKFLNP